MRLALFKLVRAHRPAFCGEAVQASDVPASDAHAIAGRLLLLVPAQPVSPQFQTVSFSNILVEAELTAGSA